MKIEEVKTFEDLKLAKHEFFNGEIKELQVKLRTAKPEEKTVIGKRISEMKRKAEEVFATKAKEIELAELNKKIESQWVDVTVPVSKHGSLHPLTIVENRFREWLNQNGYTEGSGQETESEEYNFERLNIPKDHPARDMQDTLYLKNGDVMRTHNTGFTARELEENPNKALRHYAIGKVYRNDEDDRTHSHQFKQVDLVAVGYYTMPNLIWTLKSLMSYVFEESVEIRLRPSYFPFTEPSVEVDIFYREQWIEVLGAGMLNKVVLKNAGYTNDMNGFAAGIGIERITMIKYGIKDIREFYINDMRFNRQFKEVE